MINNQKIRSAFVLLLLILFSIGLLACSSSAAEIPSATSGKQSPSGQPLMQGQQPPQGPPPQEGQEPPSPRQAPDMTVVYEKMAEILGISTDKIADAFEQARIGGGPPR